MSSVITSRPAGLGELMLPGIGIGASTGVLAGAVAAIADLPGGLILVNALALGVSMGLLGGCYTLLCAYGKIRIGAFGPAAAYWLLAFPLARIVQESSVHMYVVGRPGLPEALWSFVLYNALLSTGLAFGFIWLHEKLVPLWLMRIRGHNPLAASLFEVYSSYAAAMYEQKERREARRKAMREARRRMR